MVRSKYLRWTLDSSKGKFRCPGCLYKGRLSPYWDNVAGVLMSVDRYGLCDRRNSCGYHVTPYMDNVKDIGYYYRAREVKKRLRYHLSKDGYRSRTAVIDTVNCNLARTIDSKAVFSKYGCRTEVGQPDLVYYPYVDRDGNLRAVPGHRYRVNAVASHNKRTWYHRVYPQDRLYNDQEKKVDCFFGEDLLVRYPGRVVGIVEGPKTALFCEKWFGRRDINWLATFNSHTILADLRSLSLLHNLRVEVFPDKDSYGYWHEVVSEADRLYPNMRIRCNDLMGRFEDGESDIGDILWRTRKGFELD